MTEKNDNYIENLSTFESIVRYVRQIQTFDIFWGILILYSFFPQRIGREILWARWFDIPISYIPFYLIFAILFIKFCFSFAVRGHFTLLIYKPICLLLAFLAYIPLQLLLLSAQNRQLFFKDFLVDYAMLCFYVIVFFYTVTLYFRKKADPLKAIDKVINNSFKYLSIICIFSLLRYLIYDIHYAILFFNLFHPLGYRLIEVLFLNFFSILAIGWYFATRKKIYLVYFFFYSIALIIAGSRTGYVAFIITISYLTIRLNFKDLFRYVLPSFVFIVLVGTWLGGNVVKNKIRLLRDLPLFVALDFEKGVKERRSSRRLGYWVGSLEIFKENPYFGVGIGKRNFSTNFPTKYKRSRVVARPHNTYFYFLASTGVVGISLLGMFWWSILKHGYKSYRSLRFKKFIAEKTMHLLIGNILILVIQFGYQFETGPFVWIFWAISFSWFYFTVRQNTPSSVKAALQHTQT